MSEGEYNIKVCPTDNKTWREARQLEFVLTVEVGVGRRSFRGLADLTGIVIRGG